MIWVAQITEPVGTQGQATVAWGDLKARFPGYDFSIMQSPAGHYVIGKPKADTILYPEDETGEREMLLHITTALLEDHIGCRTIGEALDYLVESYDIDEGDKELAHRRICNILADFAS